MTALRALVIPHVPLREGLRPRSWDMARFLAADERFQVSFLTWRGAADVRGFARKVWTRLREAPRQLRHPITREHRDHVRYLGGPYLLAPRVLGMRFNEAALRSLIEREGFDLVISANGAHFPAPKRPNSPWRYVHDVVDNHVMPGAQKNWRSMRRFLRSEIDKADLVSVITRSMETLVLELGARRTLHVPNGVDLGAARAVRPDQVRDLRARFHLEGRFSISFIGNHHMAVSGLEFLLTCFQELRRRLPEAALLVVGPIADLEGRRARTGADSGVIFTGPVPPADIAPYFAAADLGVMPSELTTFRHYALPLKLLEYGAARRRALSSPLRELVLLKLPHVDLVDRDRDLWVEAMLRHAHERPAWDAGWDALIEDFDWRRIVRRFADVLAALCS